MAGKVFLFSISIDWSEQSAVSWGKYAQTYWTPPSSTTSSTLQITSVVASGAQIITLGYFSSHTLLLKSWLFARLAAWALIASRHAIDPTPPPPDMNGQWSWWREQSRSPYASADLLKHRLIDILVCPIMETAKSTNYCNMHIKLHIEMGSLRAGKLKSGTSSNSVHLRMRKSACFFYCNKLNQINLDEFLLSSIQHGSSKDSQ